MVDWTVSGLEPDGPQPGTRSGFLCVKLDGLRLVGGRSTCAQGEGCRQRG